MQRRKVDLPDPDGPRRHITSRWRDLEGDPLEHFEQAVALVDGLGTDHRSRHLRPAR